MSMTSADRVDSPENPVAVVMSHGGLPNMDIEGDVNVVLDSEKFWSDGND
jgi:hypothetical protein